ncbi:hypothetical protein AGLY_012825 [Aphis glycines]|uniref:Uncharacterized protein n=1 Tax=Aphis glycines TaxID=307491 RepID=A0A6G0T874_APHGL|nr:hypothetical protein AGLY_012825 [Aphis glycines]
MNFRNSLQKVATWSAASYLYVREFLEFVSVLIQNNKHVIMYLIIPFMTSWTMKYFSTNVWLLYVARLIAGSVIFIFASSLLVQRAGRRERYQILLEASQGYELAKIEALKRRFDAIFPPLGVLDSPKSMEVAVADAPRTIDERLDTLEDAVRSLSAKFAKFTFNHVVTNQAPTVQAPTNRAPPIHTSAQTRTVTKSWCYYHIRFGKDSWKCSSDLYDSDKDVSYEPFKKSLSSDKSVSVSHT